MCRSKPVPTCILRLFVHNNNNENDSTVEKNLNRKHYEHFHKSFSDLPEQDFVPDDASYKSPVRSFMVKQM